MLRSRIAALRARLAAGAGAGEGVGRQPPSTVPWSSRASSSFSDAAAAATEQAVAASAAWPDRLSLPISSSSSSSSSSTPIYDTIVVGLGAQGSSALYHLARQQSSSSPSSRVLGIEAAPTCGHSSASHGGDTRITRQAYFESPTYVPLLRRSYALTAELERLVKRQLFWRTGVIHAGGRLYEGALAAAQLHGVEHEVMVAADGSSSRWPGYSFPKNYPVLWEPGAGILAPDLMIRAHTAAAVATGQADVVCGDGVKAWGSDGVSGLVAVETQSGRVFAARRALILAAGAWMPRLVPELAGLAVPRRYTVAWLEAAEKSDDYALGAFPPFLVEEPGTGVPYYGFPAWPHEGAAGSGAVVGGRSEDEPDDDERHRRRRSAVKLGAFLPSSGDLSEGGKADPGANLERSMTAEDERAVRSFADACLPGLKGGEVASFAACIFTDTPDGHFVVDAHPRFDGKGSGARVVLCSACSGHGFKLSPAVGEALADLVSGGGAAVQKRYGGGEDVLGLHRLRADRPGVAEVMERFHRGEGTTTEG
jgi:sarcosine oxidase